MATTSDYLTQLQTDKRNLVTNLVEKGVEASEDETFTTLVPKVSTIVTEPNLQDKEVTITENTTTSIQADEGYDGLNRVNVVTNVPTGGTVPEVGFIVNEFNERGYATDITIVGMTEIPQYAIGSNSTVGNFLKTYIVNVNIPDNVTSIGKYGFGQLSYLKMDKLPTSLTTLDEAAFVSCFLITIKQIPDGVTSIPNLCFSQCQQIKQLSMSNVTTLTSGASSTGCFYGCINLRAVWIGSAITSSGFGRYVFRNCTKLTRMFIDLPRATVEAFTNYRYAFSSSSTTAQTLTTDVIICNDDEGFVSKEEFDNTDWTTV